MLYSANYFNLHTLFICYFSVEEDDVEGDEGEDENKNQDDIYNYDYWGGYDYSNIFNDDDLYPTNDTDDQG